jgi:ketosteroid isomerase-like protein
MTKAATPEDVSRLIASAITEGDLEAALGLFEPEATLVMPRAVGGGSATGQAALREALTGFLSIAPILSVHPEKTFAGGDIALLVGTWTLKGRAPDGREINIAGRHSDVVRQQADGSWLFVIDNPDGTN